MTPENFLSPIESAQDITGFRFLTKYNINTSLFVFFSRSWNSYIFWNLLCKDTLFTLEKIKWWIMMFFVDIKYEIPFLLLWNRFHSLIVKIHIILWNGTVTLYIHKFSFIVLLLFSFRFFDRNNFVFITPGSPFVNCIFSGNPSI